MTICIICLVFTYGIFGLLTASFLSRCRSRFPGLLPVDDILLAGFVTAPIVLSAITTFCFFIAPNASAAFSMVAVSLVSLTFLWLGRKEFRSIFLSIKHFFRRCLTLFRRFPVRSAIFAAFFIVFWAHLVLQGVFQPIVAHDSSLYAWMGRDLSLRRTLVDYPANPAANEPDMYVPGMRHPPGLISLYAWFHFWGGQGENSLLMCRTVSVIYGLYLLWILCHFARKRGVSSIWTILIYCATPTFCYQIIGNSLDPMRLSLLYLTLFMFFNMLINEGRAGMIASGISTFSLFALSIFVHLGNFISIPFFIVAYLIFSKRISLKLKLGMGFIALVLFIATQVLLWNVDPAKSKCLSMFSFNPKLIEASMTQNRIENVVGEMDEYKKLSQVEKIWRERFQIFSRPEIFGATFYLALAGVAWLLIAGKSRKQDTLLLLFTISVLVVVLYRFYLNYRYISAIAGCAVYFGGMTLERAYLFCRRRSNSAANVLVNMICLMALCFGLIVLVKGWDLKKRVVYSESTLFSRLMKQIDKFSRWKWYSHPKSWATLEIVDKLEPEDRVLLVLDRKLPCHYLYMNPKQSMLYVSKAFPRDDLMPIGNTSEALDYLRKSHIRYIVVEPKIMSEWYVVCSQLKNIFKNPEMADKLYDFRDIKVYEIK